VTGGAWDRGGRDFAVDESPHSCVAVCLHCGDRLLRDRRDQAADAMREHVRTAHLDAPGVRARLDQQRARRRG
jgi:hypothetical protein